MGLIKNHKSHETFQYMFFLQTTTPKRLPQKTLFGTVVPVQVSLESHIVSGGHWLQ